METTALRKINQILSALKPDEYERLSPHLEPVAIGLGMVIHEIDQPVDYVYFPLNSVISLVKQMQDGKIIEVGLVGKDGMSGMAALLGCETSDERAIVQLPNIAFRAKVDAIRDEFNLGGTLQRRLLAYAQIFMRQVIQTVACNASHTAEVRLCRWLLMCHDRVHSKEVELRREFIAEMLGTSRATVNAAAMTLQSANLIKCNRGIITITDRNGLEKAACECYRPLDKRV